MSVLNHGKFSHLSLRPLGFSQYCSNSIFLWLNKLHAFFKKEMYETLYAICCLPKRFINGMTNKQFFHLKPTNYGS